MSDSDDDSRLPLINPLKSINSSTGGGFTHESILLPDEDLLGEDVNKNKLGTVTGVIIPCCLSIWGVILFERVAWCVGQSGLYLVLGLITISYLVVTLTTLSIAAISSNGKMKGGGAYFMISRTLGPELGGAIGFIFYCANIAGCALYLVGFSSALESAFSDSIPTSRWWLFAYSSAVLALLTMICLVGAGAYAKTAVIIFVVLIISISIAVGSFVFQPSSTALYQSTGYTGFNVTTLAGNLLPAFQDAPSGAGTQTAFTIFGIYFPAATGIMAGANMSGDLREPSKSIPKGTLIAVGLTYVTYCLLAVLLSFTTARWGLVGNYFVMQNVCVVWWVVTIGIICSTLSSALGNQIGSSRVLQALARDNLIPFFRPFAKGSKKGDEPRRAVFLSWALVQGLLLVGDLDVIASITTLFFLLSYGICNMAAFALRVTGTSNFRPVFNKSNRFTSFFGALLCFGVMFVVNPVYASISFSLLLVLLFYIHYAAPRVDWGHLSQALMYHQVRKYLLKLDVRKEHVKYWRPQMLLLCNNPVKDIHLIDFVNNLKKGGLFVIGNVIVGEDFTELRQVHEQHEGAWLDFITQAKVKAFASVVVARSVRAGVQSMLAITGLGALKPNTVIFGFPEAAVAGLDAWSTVGSTASASTFGAGDGGEDGGDGDDGVGAGGVGPGAVPDRMMENTMRRTDSLKAVIGPVGKWQEQQDSLDAHEFVSLMKDAILMNKNLIVARNFDQLNKDLVVSRAREGAGIGGKKRLTIDLWPINPLIDGFDDNSFTLTLLMGYILTRTDVWKKYTRLRVLTYVTESQSIIDEEDKLQRMLLAARIPAEVLITAVPRHKTAEWAGVGSDSRETTLRNRYAIINSLMRQHSMDAAVIFSSLLAPPNDPAQYEEYIAGIDVLTKGLPPMAVVHGIDTFITTEI